MKKNLIIRLVKISFLTISIFYTLPLLKTQTAKSATTHLVISEVQIAGLGGVNEDFIEIYNPTPNAIDLKGYRLVKRSANGTSDTSIKAWSSQTLIPAGGYYLWANSSWTPPVTPDAATSQTISANNGIALRFGPENTGTIIDSVAWGSVANAFVEGSPFPTNPAAGQSLERIGDDTDNNSIDFILQTNPNPQNSEIVLNPTTIPTPTDISTATPTITTPSATPTPIPPSSTPTPTIQPTPTPLPTPTLAEKIVGRFWLEPNKTSCTFSFRVKSLKFFILLIPRIICK